MDSRYPKDYRPSVKKDRSDTNQEYWDGDKIKEKIKSYNLSSTNIQPQIQVSKKDKRHRSRQRDHSATEVNATKVVKKNKDKAKDLSHFKYYTCKQKGYYASKCPKKPRK